MEVTTELDIFNQAFAEIGHHGLNTADEDNPEGRACRRFYDNEFESLLKSAAWPFAEKEALLDPAWDELTATTGPTISGPLAMTWDAAAEVLRILLAGHMVAQAHVESGTISDRRTITGLAANHGELVDLAADSYGRVYALGASADDREAMIYRVKLSGSSAAEANLVAKVDLDGADRFAWVHDNRFVLFTSADKTLWKVEPSTSSVEAWPCSDHAITGLEDVTWSGQYLYGADDAVLYGIDWLTGSSAPLVKLPAAVPDVDHMTWDGGRFLVLDAGRLYQVRPRRSRDQQMLFLKPPDFVRKWDWDAETQQSDVPRQEDHLVEQGALHMRSPMNLPSATLRYVHRPPLGQTDSLFQQLLVLRLARRLGPRFGGDNWLIRELHVEELKLMRAANAVARSQRERQTERTATDVHRYSGYGRRGVNRDSVLQGFREG